MANISNPNATLYISNTPPNTSLQDVRRFFSGHGTIINVGRTRGVYFVVSAIFASKIYDPCQTHQSVTQGLVLVLKFRHTCFHRQGRNRNQDLFEGVRGREQAKNYFFVIKILFFYTERVKFELYEDEQKTSTKGALGE